MESAELGLFMISACLFTTVLEYPASPARRLLPTPFVRHALIGVAMALTLLALIHCAWGKRSGAHMNPVVTLAAAATDGLRWHAVPAYLVAQIVGAILGVWLAHIMFDLPLWQFSQHVRTGIPQWVAEVVATFGLLMVIWGCRAHREPVTAFAVAAYITGAYWFTASTSFANPAVTIARALSNTFAGIRPTDAPGFIVAEFVGLALVLPLLRRLSSTAAER